MSALLTPKPVDWIWPWSCTWPVVSILQWSINSMLLEQGFSMSPLLPFGHFTVGGFLVHCTMSSSISGLYTHTHTHSCSKQKSCQTLPSVCFGGWGWGASGPLLMVMQHHHCVRGKDWKHLSIFHFVHQSQKRGMRFGSRKCYGPVQVGVSVCFPKRNFVLFQWSVLLVSVKYD